MTGTGGSRTLSARSRDPGLHVVEGDVCREPLLRLAALKAELAMPDLGVWAAQCDHSSVPRKEGPVHRRLLFVTALVTSLVAGAVATANRPAEAAFSGVNGKIVFTRELVFGSDEIFVMNADGSDQTDLTNNPQPIISRPDHLTPRGSPLPNSPRRHQRHLCHERRRHRPDEPDEHCAGRRWPGLVARRNEDCLCLFPPAPTGRSSS